MHLGEELSEAIRSIADAGIDPRLRTQPVGGDADEHPVLVRDSAGIHVADRQARAWSADVYGLDHKASLAHARPQGRQPQLGNIRSA